MAKAPKSSLSIRAPGSSSSAPSATGNGHDQTTDDAERGLLSHSNEDDDDEQEDDLVVYPEPPKTPRTPNRVRFDLPPSPSTGPNAEPDDFPPSYDLSEGDSHPLLPHSPTTTTAASRSTSASGYGHSRRWSWNGDPSTLLSGPLEHLNRPKSSLRSAMSNMANSIIGAGIIGQPYALKQAGLLAGTILLIALTITVDWTIRLIVINAKLCGRDSFQGTVGFCFGRKGLWAVGIAQWAFAFGGMVAFGVIIGDSIPRVVEAVWPGIGEVPVLELAVNRRFVIAVCVAAVSWPLSLYRDIAKLAKASTLALISMIIILITVITQGASTPPQLRGDFPPSLLLLNTGIFQSIGVISFAFVCHHNSLLIYTSLKTPTLDRFSLVTHISTSVSLLACLAMALSGFLTFGSLTQGNVLNNFPADNVMVNVARFCFGLNMLTTLPLEAFVCREVMFNAYLGEGVKAGKWLHFGVSTGLVFSATAIALVVCDLGAVFELIGATSACALAYILPPLCYLKLSKRSWRSWVAGGVVVFGFGVLGVSVVMAVMKLWKGGEGAKCH